MLYLISPLTSFCILFALLSTVFFIMFLKWEHFDIKFKLCSIKEMLHNPGQYEGFYFSIYDGKLKITSILIENIGFYKLCYNTSEIVFKNWEISWWCRYPTCTTCKKGDLKHISDILLTPLTKIRYTSLHTIVHL